MMKRKLREHFMFAMPIYIIVIALVGWFLVATRENFYLTTLYPFYVLCALAAMALHKYVGSEFVDTSSSECRKISGQYFGIFLGYAVLLAVVQWFVRFDFAILLFLVFSGLLILYYSFLIYRSSKNK